MFSGKGHSNQVQDMAVTDGKLVSVGMDDTIRFTDLSNNQFGYDTVIFQTICNSIQIIVPKHIEEAGVDFWGCVLNQFGIKGLEKAFS